MNAPIRVTAAEARRAGRRVQAPVVSVLVLVPVAALVRVVRAPVSAVVPARALVPVVPGRVLEPVVVPAAAPVSKAA